MNFKRFEVFLVKEELIDALHLSNILFQLLRLIGGCHKYLVGM